MEVEALVTRFGELIVAPFSTLDTAWGILPIYVSLLLGEMYKRNVNWGHAVGNGFTMLWAGLTWIRHLLPTSHFPQPILPWSVTLLCCVLGLYTIFLGMRKKNKTLIEVLGHTRFTCYFLITVYPMQTGFLMPWSWTSVGAILIFAVPVWFTVYLFGRVASHLVK